MSHIVADVSALVCIWGYDSMCIRDKGKHTALRLSRRQAQNIWDFAHSVPSGLVFGEMRVRQSHRTSTLSASGTVQGIGRPCLGRNLNFCI